MTFYIGIDIGGTKIAGGLVTHEGHVVHRTERPTPPMGGQAILDTAIAVAREVMTGETIEGVGIGTGGQIDADRGIVISATEVLPKWAGMNVKAGFEKALGVPSAVENDVNALAVGEARFGAACRLATVVFLALGTGVGGALLLNGHLHHGAHWVGGEFGHILLNIEPDARRDASGHIGCLEAYCSGPGLAQTWREMAGSADETVTGHMVGDWARQDPNGIAAQAVRKTGEYLGCGLTSLANALDPDRFVIGGGLASLGDTLLNPARQILVSRAITGLATGPVVTATLGADASIIGAASLIMPHQPC